MAKDKLKILVNESKPIKNKTTKDIKKIRRLKKTKTLKIKY